MVARTAPEVNPRILGAQLIGLQFTQSYQLGIIRKLMSSIDNYNPILYLHTQKLQLVVFLS